MSDLANEAVNGAIENGARRLEQILGDIERAAREAGDVVEQAKTQAAVLAGSIGVFESKPAIVLSGYASNLSFMGDYPPTDMADVRLYPVNQQLHVRRVAGDGKLASGDYAVVVALIPVATRKGP